MPNISLPNNTLASSFDAVGKLDSQNLPPSSTGPGGHDISWTNLGPALANIPGLGLTAPRAIVAFGLAASSFGLGLVTYRSVWFNATPTAPILARTSTGVFTITLPTTVSSEWDSNLSPPVINNYTVNLIGGIAQLTTDPGDLYCISVSASSNVITLTCRNSSGLSDLLGHTVFVTIF